MSSDTNTGVANFDGQGYSYSAQALQTAGVAPGQTIMVSGTATFVWPDVAPGSANNVVSRGQVIALAPPVGGSMLSFLGAGSGGDSQGSATITYTDGSTQSFQLGFSDWTLRGNTAQPSFGNAIAVDTAYRNYRDGFRNAVHTHVFCAQTPLQPGMLVASITLPPAVDRGTQHIFAISIR